MIRGMRESAAGPLVVLVLLAGCTAPEPAPPPPAPVVGAPRPRPAPPVARPVQEAAWSVSLAGDACQARAATADIGLVLRVTDGDSLSLRLAAGPARRLSRGGPQPAVFSGPAGGWRADLAPAGTDLAATLGLDETTLGWTAALLEGGTLDVGGPRLGLPLLRLPNAGAAGQRFFACARARNAGTGAAAKASS
jgi:hypothetical protein